MIVIALTIAGIFVIAVLFAFMEAVVAFFDRRR